MCSSQYEYQFTLDFVCSGLDGMAGGTSGSGSLWFSAAKVWKVNDDGYC